MKTHLKLIAVLFLAGFALLGQSCAEEEFPPRPGPAFPADVTNRYALLLQEQLQADGAAYDRYTEVLSDRTPVYEEVRFATHSAYGLCYIIPYCSPSGPTIEGAVYLPAGATCAEDGTVTFDGSLGTPIDIDAPTINRDIPFTERYTYSMPFKHLQDKGWNVDPELLLYAELLDYKTDRVQQAKELIDRYATQLKLYADALERVFAARKLKVKEILIYSFSLEQLITL